MSTDIPDLIAGALGVSRGTAYDLMRDALAKQYAEKNSLGGPAKVFDAMANAIRAGDDYHSVLRQYGYAEAHKQEEPVAWGNFKEDGTLVGLSQHPEDQANWTGRKPLYTSPPAQRTWVGLTDVEIASACKKHGGAEWWWRDIEEYGRAIEAKLKEKNSD